MSSTPEELEVEFNEEDLYEGEPDNIDRGDPDHQDDEED